MIYYYTILFLLLLGGVAYYYSPEIGEWLAHRRIQRQYKAKVTENRKWIRHNLK